MRVAGFVAAVLAYGTATVALTIPEVAHEQSVLHTKDFSKDGGERHTPKLIIEDHDGTPGTVRPRRLQGRFLHISGMLSRLLTVPTCSGKALSRKGETER